MNFLEASRILAKFTDGDKLSLRIAASGNIEPLLLYIRAAAAVQGKSAILSTLPFGMLSQALLTSPIKNEQEVLLLFPWDFLPECDWRSGIPIDVPHSSELLTAAQKVANTINQRQSALLYLPAPILPLYSDPMECSSLGVGLSGLASSLGAQFIDPVCFSLSNYLASGFPIAGEHMGEVADILVKQSIKRKESTAKVLVTDLDNVLWSGLAAEDGPTGIHCDSEGVGYRHFLYQGLLAKLKASGVLLAAVSRNDLEVARSPISAGKTLLTENDFIEILASYEPKSVHIRRLAETFNLSLDAFVFVDDNPIELAEVSAALSQVRCLQFPSHDDQLIQLFDDLSKLFARRSVSSEDKHRTEMYRRRKHTASTISFVEQTGADLTDFLAKLGMELTIFNRSFGDRARAIQLINKTNQFNLNGRRMTDNEVANILNRGGHFFTAKLDDRTGSHGEILACLIDEKQHILTFVLSCRVFQRRVEHAFFCWLIRHLGTELTLSYASTEKNTPMSDFLKDQAFAVNEDKCVLDGSQFLSSHAVDLELFSLKEIDIA